MRLTAVVVLLVFVNSAAMAQPRGAGGGTVTTRPLHDGSFRIIGLPPGDYWIAAVDRMDTAPGPGPASLPDSELLDSLTLRGTRFTFAEEQSRDFTLSLIRR